MTKPVFLTHKEAEAAGWFSRRHETADAHRQASTTYKATRGKEARRRRASERDRRDAA
jgi:hypothetical protein